MGRIGSNWALALNLSAARVAVRTGSFGVFGVFALRSRPGGTAVDRCISPLVPLFASGYRGGLAGVAPAFPARIVLLVAVVIIIAFRHCRAPLLGAAVRRFRLLERKSDARRRFTP